MLLKARQDHLHCLGIGVPEPERYKHAEPAEDSAVLDAALLAEEDKQSQPLARQDL